MLKIYFDGGCRPNPGRAEGAVVVVEEGLEPIVHHYAFGDGTSSRAEWEALLMATAVALEHPRGRKGVEFIGDSKNTVKQAREEWKCHDETLATMRSAFRVLSRGLTHTITWVRRGENLAGHYLEKKSKC